MQGFCLHKLAEYTPSCCSSAQPQHGCACSHSAGCLTQPGNATASCEARQHSLSKGHAAQKVQLHARPSTCAGRTIFHGPRQDVEGFFSGLGFRCPPRKGVPNFLQEVHSHATWACCSTVLCGTAPASLHPKSSACQQLLVTIPVPTSYLIAQTRWWSCPSMACCRHGAVWVQQRRSATAVSGRTMDSCASMTLQL